MPAVNVYELEHHKADYQLPWQWWLIEPERVYAAGFPSRAAACLWAITVELGKRADERADHGGEDEGEATL